MEEKKIICRKCSGPHLTIKCGKEKKEYKEYKPNVNVNVNVNENKNYKNRNYFRNVNRVKITDLPTDMTEEEMMELTYDWGHIVKIKVLNYNESSTAYIDFEYKNEAEYFVKALDKTPFEYILISARLVALI